MGVLPHGDRRLQLSVERDRPVLGRRRRKLAVIHIIYFVSAKTILVCVANAFRRPSAIGPLGDVRCYDPVKTAQSPEKPLHEATTG